MPDPTPALPVPDGLKHRHMNLMIEIRRGDTVQRNYGGQDIVRRQNSYSGRCDKDLRLLAKDVKNAQDDIDDMRATLSKVVFIGLGAIVTFVIGLLTAIIYGSQGVSP